MPILSITTNDVIVAFFVSPVSFLVRKMDVKAFTVKTFPMWFVVRHFLMSVVQWFRCCLVGSRLFAAIAVDCRVCFRAVYRQGVLVGGRTLNSLIATCVIYRFFFML